jgi:hypothetical protein
MLQTQKVAGSTPEEANVFFFRIYLILLATLGPGVYITYDINEYHKQKSQVSGKKSAAGA